MEDIAGRYRRRADDFERTIRAVRPEQWGNQSPCARWTARDVVDHVVAMHRHVLTGAGRPATDAPTVADDPLGAFRAVRRDVDALLADPVASATPCDTPVGRMSAAEHVDRVASDDLPPHGWDLARATGQVTPIDPRDVEHLWSVMSSIPPDVMARYRTPGAFGPGVEVYGPEAPVAADASLHDRLLGAMGRDPAWRLSDR